MNNPYQYHVKSSSTEYKIMDYNYAEFIKFKKVLHRIMNDTDLRRRIGILSSKKEGTYHENTPSLYAALHLQLMAIEAKKQALEENTNPKHSTTL